MVSRRRRLTAKFVKSGRFTLVARRAAHQRFGLPDKIISDRGPQFASKAFTELLKLLGIKSALSTAYHPQTDGTTERVNQEIKAYLSIYCA